MDSNGRPRVAEEQDNNVVDTITNTHSKTELRQAVNKLVFDISNKEEKLLLRVQETLIRFRKNTQDKTLSDAFRETFDEYTRQVLRKNGRSLFISVHPEDIGQAHSLRIKLMKEYNAQTTTELLIIDQMVSAYLRSMRTSRVYNILIQDAEGVIHFDSQERMNMIKELNKQIDMANRHFLLLTTYLKDLRQPPLSIKVQTKQAFIAQNQQLNTNP